MRSISSRGGQVPRSLLDKKSGMASACCGIFDKARVLEVTEVTFCPAVPAACCAVFRKYLDKLNVGLRKGFVNARVRIPSV